MRPDHLRDEDATANAAISPEGRSSAAPWPPTTDRIPWQGDPAVLRRDIPTLASILRARAAGAVLGPEELRALEALRAHRAVVVAWHYAEGLVEGDVLAAVGTGQPSSQLDQLYETIAGQRAAAVQRHQHQRDQRSALPGIDDTEPLAAAVLAELAADAFGDMVAQVLADRQLPPRMLGVPDRAWWDWLAATGLDPTHSHAQLPAEVHRLRELGDEEFLLALVEDCRDGAANRFLRHAALAERCAQFGPDVEALLLDERDRAAAALPGHLPTNRPGRLRLSAFKAAARACARGGARHVMAIFMLSELRERALAFPARPAMRELRTRVLIDATARWALYEPALTGLVVWACAEHRLDCPAGEPSRTCSACVHTVAERVTQWQHGRTELGRWPWPVLDESRQARRKSSTSAVSRCSGVFDAEHFICPDAWREPPDPGAFVAFVATCTTADTELVGIAWYSSDDTNHTEVSVAAGAHDGMVLALCRAALALGDKAETVYLATSDPDAAAVVNHVVKTGGMPGVPGTALSPQTLGLLLAVAHRAGTLSVLVDTCPAPHSGAMFADLLSWGKLITANGRSSAQPYDATQPQPEIDPPEGESALIGPQDEGDPVWWLPATAGAVSGRPPTAWQTALFQMHLDGGWCPLPDNLIADTYDGGRLTLRTDQWGDAPHLSSLQTVTLRRRGGQWELSGIRWPHDVRPGQIITFDWPPNASVVAAHRRTLAQPVRLDDTIFRHEYDPQVVTRELIPGADQDRAVPDLSDASWVTRTVRRLGYLSTDGTAVLEESTLIRNCLDLGMPRSMTTWIPRAVQRLCEAGVLRRVAGSRDDEDRPWYPAQAGQTPVDLLYYIPKTQAVDHDPAPSAGHGMQDPRRGHWVTGFVRRLPDGAEASEEQIDAHRDAAIAAGVMRQPLRDGYTFVRQHRRGRGRGNR